MTRLGITVQKRGCRKQRTRFRASCWQTGNY